MRSVGHDRRLVTVAFAAARAQVAEEEKQAKLLSERAAREARMEDAIVRARIRLEHEEQTSWSRRVEQAALAVSNQTMHNTSVTSVVLQIPSQINTSLPDRGPTVSIPYLTNHLAIIRSEGNHRKILTCTILWQYERSGQPDKSGYYSKMNLLRFERGCAQLAFVI